MQEVRRRWLECDGLNALEQIRLTELGRMKSCRPLSFADKNSMNLLTQRAFLGCHQYRRTTPDSVCQLTCLG